MCKLCVTLTLANFPISVPDKTDILWDVSNVISLFDDRVAAGHGKLESQGMGKRSR